MSTYLYEATLAEVFPLTLEVNGTSFTLDSTDNLHQGMLLMFQWGVYSSGDDWLIRFCKPNDASAPTRYFYDQIAKSDADGLSLQTWALDCIVQCSNLWND